MDVRACVMEMIKRRGWAAAVCWRGREKADGRQTAACSAACLSADLVLTASLTDPPTLFCGSETKKRCLNKETSN